MKWIVSLAILLLFFSTFYWSSTLFAPRGKLFWMPFCPYGQTAAREMLKILEEDGALGKIDFCYIATEHSVFVQQKMTKLPLQASLQPAGCDQMISLQPDFSRFSSLNGQIETEESVRQVAIIKRWPKCFTLYLNAFLDNPNADWRTRALQAGIPASELNDLIHSATAAAWFSQNVQQARKLNVTRSPSLLLGGNLVKKFPSSRGDLQTALCAVGILQNTCEGILCNSRSPCPRKFGYSGICERGACVYKPAPQRADALNCYLVIPENSILAMEFSEQEALLGWASYLSLKRINLGDPQAQNLLKGARITSFPVLVIDDNLLKRRWGLQLMRELNLVEHQGRFLVSFDYPSPPFLSHTRIVSGQNGIRVEPNHHAVALVLHQMGKLSAAAKSYRLALAEAPENFQSWNNLGALLYDNLDMKEAGRMVFHQAVALNTSYEPALKNLLRVALDANDVKLIESAQERLGWLAIENKRWEEAAALLLEVSKTKEWEFSARKGLAYIAVQESRPMDALKELERCLQLNSEPDGDFSNLLGGVYFRLGDHASAVTWYERAVNTANPSGQAYPNLCYLLQAAERWGQLLTISDKALSLYPQNFAFGFYKAEALARLGQPSEAISLLKELRQTSEEAEFRSSYELARLYRDQKDKLPATMYARQFVQKVAVQREPAVREECMNIGKLALEFDETALASEAFQQVLRIKPSDVAAHALLATCYKQLGQEERSQDHQTLARQFGGAVE